MVQFQTQPDEVTWAGYRRTPGLLRLNGVYDLAKGNGKFGGVFCTSRCWSQLQSDNLRNSCRIVSSRKPADATAADRHTLRRASSTIYVAVQLRRGFAAVVI